MNTKKTYLEIEAALEEPFDLKQAVKIYAKYSKNFQNKMLVAKATTDKKRLVTAFLKELLSIHKPKEIVKQENKTKAIKKTKTPGPKKKIIKSIEQKLQEEFPKLKFKNLPDTLKLLVYERYQAWEESKKQHSAQHKAENNQERFEAAKLTVEAIKKNWGIWEELYHFHKHGELLGKHPKFQENTFEDEIRELEKKPAQEYTKEFTLMLRRFRNSINRYKGIKKKDGDLSQKQKENLEVLIYKYNYIATKLGEPEWKK